MRLLNRFFSRFNRRPALGNAPAPSEPLPRDASLLRWIEEDGAPAYPWAELAAHPARVEAARLMLEGAPLERIEPLLAQLDAGGAQRIDRMLRADVWIRQGSYERAVPLLRILAEGDDLWAARAALLLAEGLHDHGELAEAAALAEHACAIVPHTFGGLILLGCVRDNQGRHEEALALFRRALAQRPKSLLAIGHVSVALLGLGALREGLTTYAVADDLIGAYPRQDVCAVWRGEPLGARSLLVISAYGYGDVMQLLRFVPQLREREPGARLFLQIEAPLLRLARQTGWFEAVYEGNVDRAAFGWQVSTIRLPLALGTTMQDLRPFDPYLRIADADVAAAGAWLPARRPGVKRIGLRWYGRPMHFDAKRNIPFARLRPLFEVPGIEWVALVEDAQAMVGLEAHPLLDVSTHLVDFYATGALMRNLDLVISADTSAVHLGGALGLPVWMLARPDYEWRWGDAGATSPWYGSLRIFRHQPGEFDWDALVAEVVTALRAWTAPAR